MKIKDLCIWVQPWKSQGEGSLGAIQMVRRSEYEKIIIERDNLLSQITSLNQDKLRLDLLDTVNAEFNKRNGTTYGWAVDWNHNRISLRDSDAMKKSVRQAIDDFSSRIKKVGE